MKIHNDFILKEVAGNFLIVPTGEKLIDFTSMITINETGVFLWNYLKEGASKEELVEIMLKEYEIGKDVVEKDIDEFIEVLKTNNILE